jgi:hypothetical protein
MFGFFAVGLILYAIFIRDILPWSFHDDDSALRHKEEANAIVGVILMIGLPTWHSIRATRRLWHLSCERT